MDIFIFMFVLLIIVVAGLILLTNTGNNTPPKEEEEKNDAQEKYSEMTEKVKEEEELVPEETYPDVKGIKFLEEGNRYGIEVISGGESTYEERVNGHVVCQHFKGFPVNHIKVGGVLINLEEITEPVITFLNLYYDNPKRFVIKREYVPIAKITLTDKVTKEVFTSRFLMRDWCLPNFLTEDEKLLIQLLIKKEISPRLDRKIELGKIRAKREHDKERNRLKEVYCNG